MNGASSCKSRGVLVAVVGPMGAGKTGYALQQMVKVSHTGQGMWVANPIDTRSKRAPDGFSVFTHAGAMTIPAEFVVEAPRVGDAPSLSGVKPRPGVTTVFVDEVQFYRPEEIRQVVAEQWVLQLGLVVYCIGLMTDAVLQMWPATRAVLELASVVKQKRACCAFCGAAAGHTVAQFDYGEAGTVRVGTLEKYKACCLACHQLEEKKKAAAAPADAKQQ